MTEQERLEEILRNIHVLFAEAEPMLDDDDLVVVNQQDLYRLLEALNRCVADIMERYEVTQQSREAAENRTRKDLEKMVSKAQKTADEIYAASLLYMDGTLQEMNRRMQRMQKDVQAITGALTDDMEEKLRSVNENREELRAQMHTLMEDEAYLELVRKSSSLWGDEAASENAGPTDDTVQTQPYSAGAEIKIHTDAAYFRAQEEDAAE